MSIPATPRELSDTVVLFSNEAVHDIRANSRTATLKVFDTGKTTDVLYQTPSAPSGLVLPVGSNGATA